MNSEAAGNHANLEANLGTNDDSQLQTRSLLSVLKALRPHASISRK